MAMMRSFVMFRIQRVEYGVSQLRNYKSIGSELRDKHDGFPVTDNTKRAFCQAGWYRDNCRPSKGDFFI